MTPNFADTLAMRRFTGANTVAEICPGLNVAASAYLVITLTWAACSGIAATSGFIRAS
jgi:hypothetical protein